MYGMNLRRVQWIVHMPSTLEVHNYLNKEFTSISISDNSASSDTGGQNSEMKIILKFAVKHAFDMIIFCCI
jgi:hypothetical protein